MRKKLLQDKLGISLAVVATGGMALSSLGSLIPSILGGLLVGIAFGGIWCRYLHEKEAK